MSKYFCQTEKHSNFKLAEKIPNKTTDIFCKTAKEFSVILVLSLFEKKISGMYHNTVLIINEKGKIINKYRKKGSLKASLLGRGGAWLDTGSIDDFYKTSAFVSEIEKRQGLKVACIEEIALSYNWIGKKEINNQIKFYGKCEYSEYLKNLIITKK